MRLPASLALVPLLAACGSAAAPPAPVAPPSSIAPIVETAPPAPFGIRFVRTCSEWSQSRLVATSERLVSCGDAVEDTRGVLREVRPFGRPCFVLADRAFFSPQGTDDELDARGEATLGFEDLVVYDARLARIGALDLEEELGAVLELDGVLYGGDALGVVSIDPIALRATRVEGSDSCARSFALGALDMGRPRCLTLDDDGGLHLGGHSERLFDDPIAAAWIAPVERWLVVGRERASLFDPDGVERATLSGGDLAVHAFRDAQVLVTRDDRTELWTIAADRIDVETLFERGASGAAFFGERIVVRLPPEDVVWLERGAARTLPSIDVPAPEGFTPLSPGVSGSTTGRAIFHAWAHTEIARGRNDLAAFGDHGREVVVSYVDPVMLSDVRTDDHAWARLLADRLLLRGERRWARLWHGGEGTRVLRGHVFIGGCERTDIDILARERPDGAVELWTITAPRARDLTRLFGTEPADAEPVLEDDAYAGDPSIGPQAQ